MSVPLIDVFAVPGPVTATQRAAPESKPIGSCRQDPIKGSPGVGAYGLPPSRMSGRHGADGCGCPGCAPKIASAPAPVAPLLGSPAPGRRLPGRPSSVPVAGPGRSGGLTDLGRFERMYGADLSDVRVHDDADSRARARAYGSRAFTVGNDIYLDGAATRPGTPGGDRVVAHELAHVLQLRKGRGRSSQLAGGAA